MPKTDPLSEVQALDDRVADLLGKMTLVEKVSLLAGRDLWYTVPVERLGIPSLVMTDGPHGVRSSNPETGRKMGPATCFPTGVSMAATWNSELIQRVGEALGEETLGMDCDILLGPCVNIVRAPLAGRNFEAYSEDPFLAGRIAVAWIKGVQGAGAGTSLKHFAANSHEIERMRSSSEVDERTLREIYLPAFEAAVTEAQPWTVMCSYNRLNGTYASENEYLLTELLRDEWGFEGFVVSDWGAVHSTVAPVAAGLDLEMPGPAKWFGRLLAEGVLTWQLDESIVDEAARRVLRILALSGRLDGKPRQGSVNTPEHQALAREVAEEAITLLKNEGSVLPLAQAQLSSIAVIGPNALEAHIGGGGSSYVYPPYQVSPLQALKERLGEDVRIEYAQGCDNYVEPPVPPGAWLTLPDGNGNGMRGEFWNNPSFSGAPDVVRSTRLPRFFWFGGPPVEGISKGSFSARWTTTLRVPESDTYTFRLTNTGHARLFLDGELLLEVEAPLSPSVEEGQSWSAELRDLEAGRPYDLRLEFVKNPEQDFAVCRLALAATPRPGEDHRLEQAAEAARRCDVALVFAGMPEGFESEGSDRPHMDLPGPQDALIRAVAAANPRTVVVLNAGSPVAMPWIAEVPAVVEAYYPGQEAGHAIVNVLLGDVNPSGKLPVSFPVRLADTPAYLNMARPGLREVHYGEGIFVGYRYYDLRGVEPLFPFGHGLSYTTFEYGGLHVPAEVKAGEALEVSLTVKNTGKRAGKEVVQLYVADKAASLPRPPKELKAFAKVELQPGETKTVSFRLGDRALSFYDPALGAWAVEPGEFELLAGSSSRDIRARASFTLK